MNRLLEKFKKFFQKPSQGSDKKNEFRWGGVLLTFVFIIILSYFVASVAISFLLTSISPSDKKQIRFDLSGESLHKNPSKMNYRTFKKDVLNRNIFNESGELPDEAELAHKGESDKPLDQFSLKGTCSRSSLNLKLMGTIVLSNDKSFATVREKSVNFSDVYKIGDEVYGKPGVKVAGIRHNILILNNKGKKECLYATKQDASVGTKGKGLSSKNAGLAALEKAKTVSPAKEAKPEVRLKSEWVSAQLGSGFTKIMQEITTPPFVENGEIKGFKFYGIKSGSLLGKIGLKNGDIVTDVNSTSTSESVFVLYEALSDDREVVVSYKRGDKHYSVKVLID